MGVSSLQDKLKALKEQKEQVRVPWHYRAVRGCARASSSPRDAPRGATAPADRSRPPPPPFGWLTNTHAGVCLTTRPLRSHLRGNVRR